MMLLFNSGSFVLVLKIDNKNKEIMIFDNNYLIIMIIFFNLIVIFVVCGLIGLCIYCKCKWIF